MFLYRLIADFLNVYFPLVKVAYVGRTKIEERMTVCGLATGPTTGRRGKEESGCCSNIS